MLRGDPARRARLARGAPEYWRGLEELAETAGVPRAPASRVPAGGRGMARPGQPPPIPQSDGRFARARGTDRLHAPAARDDRALRQAAGGARPRQADVLRHRGRRCAAMRNGVIVESHEGRPTKIEGNPDHPREPRRHRRIRPGVGARPLRSRSLAGAHDASDRIRPWSAFRDAAARVDRRAALEQGRAPAYPHRDGHFADARSPAREALQQFPDAKWIQYEPATRDGAREGARLAFGEPVETRYRFGNARRRCSSIDADFVGGMPGSLRYVRDFVAARRVDPDEAAIDEPALLRGDHAHADRRETPIIGSRCGRARSRRLRARSPRLGLGVGGRRKPASAAGAWIDARGRAISRRTRAQAW